MTTTLPSKADMLAVEDFGGAPAGQAPRLAICARIFGEKRQSGALNWRNLAHKRPMRGRSAHRVNGVAVDEKVEVGPVGAVRVVARRADFLARLPPAVLATDHVFMEGVIQARASADAAGRSRYPHPVAGTDAAGGGEVGMQLDLRVGRATVFLTPKSYRGRYRPDSWLWR
jgi:hypothetical protein